MKVLIIAPCIVEDAKHVPKGSILEYNENNKSGKDTLSSLRAAGRIVPVAKENVARCLQEIARDNGAARARKETPTDPPEELLAAAKELGVGTDGKDLAAK